jgi:hypothetical protein
MNDHQWERFGAASGTVFVLLFVAGLFFGSPPDFGAPPEEVSRYYVEDQEAVQTTVVLFTAGLFFFLWFLGSLCGVLQAAEGGTGKLSAVVFGGGLVGDGIFSYVGFFGLLIWVLAASIILLRRAGAEPPAKVSATSSRSPDASSTATSTRGVGGY